MRTRERESTSFRKQFNKLMVSQEVYGKYIIEAILESYWRSAGYLQRAMFEDIASIEGVEVENTLKNKQ